jgi:hypothetical protein
MSLSYDRKIAQKLKNIDKKYVESEDKKELVGGNVNQLVDIKEGMGLEGMGLSAGMKKVIRKGKGMSAGAQLGYDGPPVWKDNAVPPFFRAGGYSAGGYCSGEGMSGGGLFDLIKIPLKLIGLGKDGNEYELQGKGLFDLMNPLKLVKLARMALGDSADGGGMSGGGFLDLVKIPLKLMGLGKNGEEYELEGGGVVVDAIKKFLMNLHPLMMATNDIKGRLKQSKVGNNSKNMMSAGNERFEGMSGLSGVGMSAGRKKRGKGMSAGAVNRTGNQGLMGYGEIPKEGAGLFDVITKVVNGPMDLINKLNPLSMSSPMDDIFGKERVRKVGTAIAEKMSGLGTRPKKGKGMGSRPTKQNMHSSSFSGGAKKPNKRAEIVKRIMKERGVKMIEASKIVKNEGLY